MRRNHFLSCAVLGALLAVVPAAAHHAASVAYDLEKVIAVRGTITEVKWENPHTWVYVEVKDADGTIVKWGFEGPVPNQLYRRGLTPSVLKPGVQVSIKAHPARDAARNFGELMEVVTAEGKSLLPGGRGQ